MTEATIPGMIDLSTLSVGDVVTQISSPISPNATVTATGTAPDGTHWATIQRAGYAPIVLADTDEDVRPPPAYRPSDFNLVLNPDVDPSATWRLLTTDQGTQLIVPQSLRLADLKSLTLQTDPTGLLIHVTATTRA